MAEAAAEFETTIGLADVTALIQARLRGRPTGANFRTGMLTVCTLVPMRSVPHRVVCLIGLDDAFPRQGIPDGDDVLARERGPASATSAARTGGSFSTRWQASRTPLVRNH